MSATTTTKPACSGYCLPLFLYGGITVLNIGAQFLYSRSTWADRFWNLLSSSFWAFMYGLIVFYFCRTCQTAPAYLLLIPPSILFGLQMLILLVRKPTTVVVPGRV